MEYIVEKEYYHIQRKQFYNYHPFWEVGQTYFCGKEKNPFIKVFDDYGPSSEKTVEHLNSAINFYQKIIRENTFEEVRQEFFSNLPSRQKCLWVIPNSNAAIDYWWESLKCENETRLLRLKLTGKIHEVNQSYLNCNYGSLDYHRQLAFKYWNGTSGKSDLDNELLFEGFATVEEIVKKSTP